MLRRALLAAALVVGPAGRTVAASKTGPQPIEPAATITPAGGEGYFDDVFGIDDGGQRLAVIRGDGATFGKIELYDLSTVPPKLAASFDLPKKALVATRLEPGASGKGALLVARERPDDGAPLFAFAIDETGKVTAKAGPATAFGRPPADGTARARLLVAFDRRSTGRGAEANFTVTPLAAATLAPAGRPRSYHADATGAFKLPPATAPLRLVGFFDGYTRLLAERAGTYDEAADVRSPPQMTVVDALAGKAAGDSEITDLVGWAVTGQLRRDHPGQALFVDLNQDSSGVDVVDAMGKRQPATLAVPFRLYDPKTLVVEEGPAPNALTFGLAIDPLNPDAIKRKKADLPMLDIYAADAARGEVKHRARVFVPRPVIWRTRGSKLLVLKRFKNFARGGDELQVFDLR